MLPIQNDQHGLTPEFQIDGKNIFSEFRENRGLFPIEQELTLINGSLQEGPPRLYEVLRFPGMSFYPTLLVSENVKRILEQFILAEHKFIPVLLQPEKMTTNLNYYILQLAYDSLLKKVDFSNLQFKQLTQKDYKSPEETELLTKGRIPAYAAIEQLKKELRGQGFVKCQLTPTSYHADIDDDVVSIERAIIVNEFVKEAIESLVPRQVEFVSVQLHNIKIPQERYDAKRSRTSLDATVSIVSPIVGWSPEFQFYHDRAERLGREDQPFTFSVVEDEFLGVQQMLNVVLPESFKTIYRQKRLPTDEYEFLPISQFYRQEIAYADRMPQAYKSVVVAENGCGDSLGLLLEKDDDHRLRATLYEFLHETGEIEAYRDF